ncbi:hypothetical protein CNR22_15190 [Sphingobacteriaceae bacterium]|nr:hypothetical protein CNR22_15190 [Sphingobacteriaceae bacterium]
MLVILIFFTRFVIYVNLFFMRFTFIKFLPLLIFLVGAFSLNAQSTKTSSSKVAAKNPASFTISKSDFELLFSKKAKDILVLKNNAFLDKSLVEINTLNGDMKFLKLKLSYFPKAYLMVQINGEYSTQIFILSDDKSVFYKGRIDKGIVTMTKCNEDDIVSE